MSVIWVLTVYKRYSNCKRTTCPTIRKPLKTQLGKQWQGGHHPVSAPVTHLVLPKGSAVWPSVEQVSLAGEVTTSQESRKGCRQREEAAHCRAALPRASLSSSAGLLTLQHIRVNYRAGFFYWVRWETRAVPDLQQVHTKWNLKKNLKARQVTVAKGGGVGWVGKVV